MELIKVWNKTCVVTSASLCHNWPHLCDTRRAVFLNILNPRYIFFDISIHPHMHTDQISLKLCNLCFENVNLLNNFV